MTAKNDLLSAIADLSAAVARLDESAAVRPVAPRRPDAKSRLVEAVRQLEADQARVGTMTPDERRAHDVDVYTLLGSQLADHWTASSILHQDPPGAA